MIGPVLSVSVTVRIRMYVHRWGWAIRARSSSRHCVSIFAGVRARYLHEFSKYEPSTCRILQTVCSAGPFQVRLTRASFAASVRGRNDAMSAFVSVASRSIGACVASLCCALSLRTEVLSRPPFRLFRAMSTKFEQLRVNVNVNRRHPWVPLRGGGPCARARSVT